MKSKIGVLIAVIGLIIFGCIIAFGFTSFGYLRSYDSKLIEVKGLSEKTIRSDIGAMSITFSNNGYANLENLYQKRVADKEKVMDFLKKKGIIDDEIVNFSMNTRDYTEENKTTLGDGVTRTDRRKFFLSEDTITIKTKQLDKIEKIKTEIVELSSKGVLITYNYSYKLTNFMNVKLEMIKDASQNALKSAQAFIEPYGTEKIGEVVYLRQGEVTIRADDESENVDSWNSKESTSINKKLRLVVSAGFTHKRDKGK